MTISSRGNESGSTPSSYGTIVCDPPWPYANPGEFKAGATPIARGSNARARYGAMSLGEITSLQFPAATNAHLYLWTTNLFVDKAFDVARAWGFRPIALCTWVKTTEEPVVCGGCRQYAKSMEIELSDLGVHSLPVGVVRASPRSGYYFKGASEHCLFAVKGKAQPKWLAPLPTVWLWPRAPHSVKPPAFYDLVENVSPGPYLELFHRGDQRLGWTTWGDECLEMIQLGRKTDGDDVVAPEVPAGA